MPHRVIGIICTSSGFGGLELNTLRLTQWLKDRGWKIHLLTAGGTALQARAGDIPSTVTAIREEGLPGKGGQLRAIHAWVKRFKIRLLFVPYNKDISVASLYKRFYDGDIALVYQQHMQVGVKKRDLIHTLRYAMIDVWISPLQYLKEEILRLTRVPEEKIEVVPFGMDATSFVSNPISRESARQQLDIPQQAYLIGVLGRLDPKKGQDLVVQALSFLRMRGDADYHLVLMGNATLNEGDVFTNQLLGIIRKEGLESCVHFRPHMDDIMPFFRAINVFAMPSHGETFGMVTIEAMAAGVPVIGTDKDGTRELLGAGRFGYLFQKEDVQDFCTQVNLVRSDARLAEKLTEARKEALDVYSSTKMVDSIENILLELIEQP